MPCHSFFTLRTGVRALMLAAALVLSALAAPSPAAANPKYAGIVVDALNNKTLYARSADKRRYPASLTKIMTLYIVFQELDAKRLSLDSRITISRRAAGQSPSRLGLSRGSKFPLRLAIPALIVKSANDVAVAVAEHIGGSEKKFAHRMTQTAKTIGMTRTQFKNASGLPNSSQYTTARDMVKLAQRLQTDFPHYYHHFKTVKFRWNNRTYRNHNTLLRRYSGTDGIKTGYIRASGFNLVSSARRDGKHLIAVVLGGKTARRRDLHAMDLLNRHFPKASRSKPPILAEIPRPLPPIRAVKASPVVLAKTETPAPPVPDADAAPAVVAKAEPPAPAAPPAPPVPDADAVPVAAAAPAVAAAPAAPVVTAAPPPAPPASPALLALAAPPGAIPIPQPPPVIPTDQGSRGSDDVETWSVQVGAYSRQQDAATWLNTVIQKKPGILDSARPITILTPSKSGKRLLYRSRFIGFADKKQARAACRSLKKIRIDCIALAPN